MFISCSEKKGNLVVDNPKVYKDGTFRCYNDTYTTLLVQWVIERNGQHFPERGYIFLSPKQQFYLWNEVDKNLGNIFRGGDILKIDIEPPHEPYHRGMWQDYILHTVDGDKDIILHWAWHEIRER